MNKRQPETETYKIPIPWRIYTVIGLIMLMVVGSIAFILQQTNNIYTTLDPLRVRISDMQLKVTTAHLLFEEILSGDRVENIETVRALLAYTEESLLALTDKEFHSDEHVRSNVPNNTREDYGRFHLSHASHALHNIREPLKVVDEKMDEFIDVLEKRYRAMQTSGPGADIDQHFDRIFVELHEEMGEIVKKIQNSKANHLAEFKIIQTSLIIICLALAVFITVILQRFERRRAEDLLDVMRSEESLRESEDKYRHLFEMEFDAIFLIRNSDGQILEVNTAGVKLYGFSREELLKMKNTDLSAEPDETRKAILKQKREVPIRYHKRKDGTVFPVEITANHFTWRGEEVHIASIRDIAKRKRAEEALEESEERLKSFYDAAFEGIAITEQGRFTDINRQFAELFGYERNELIGREVMGLVAEEDRDFVLRYIRSSFEKPYEHKALHKDGSIMFVEVHGQEIQFKGRPARVTTIHDLTKRIQSEKALRESEEKYRMLFNSTTDAVFVHQPGSDRKPRKFIEVNDVACRMYGYSREELLELTPLDLAIPELKEDVQMRVSRLLSDRYSVFEIVHKTKDGKEIPVDVSAHLFDFLEQPTVLSVVRDITDRKRAEEERLTFEAQLQQAQKMEAMGTLAGGIAHDFNNLLMGIQGSASLMQMDIDSSNPHFELLKGIDDYVKSAAELTKQLLGFARGGKYEVKTTDLNEFIKKQNRMFGRTRKEITIRGRYEKNLWTTEIDQGQIEQVLLNIYVNAWHAMPGGGNLYIQTENIIIDESYNRSYHVEPGKYVKISVADTGVGMDKATQQRIFEPFFTTREMGRGTGLGLASAYGIVKNHDGFINVYSEKGKGTTFNIYFPASEKEIIKEKKIHEEVLRGTETVLLVDDEDMIIDVGQDILKLLGYEVLPVRGGEEAVEFYEKNQDKIDMVILDMIMPDMGGGQTYDRLKEINPDIKVLLSSGYSINGQATEILERGCDGFIQKPFNIMDLSQKIREIFDKK